MSKITFEQADSMLLDFVKEHTKPGEYLLVKKLERHVMCCISKLIFFSGSLGECPMVGNTIYMDRIFIKKQLPTFHSHFHYRVIDVSSIKEIARRWFPDLITRSPKKRFSHRVVEDIEDSIEELRYYRSTMFRDSSIVAASESS